MLTTSFLLSFLFCLNLFLVVYCEDQNMSCPGVVEYNACKGMNCSEKVMHKGSASNKSKPLSFNSFTKSCRKNNCLFRLFLNSPCKTLHEIQSINLTLMGASNLSIISANGTTLHELTTADGAIKYESRDVITTDMLIFKVTLSDPANHAEHIRTEVCCKQSEEMASPHGKGVKGISKKNCPKKFQYDAKSKLCFKVLMNPAKWERAHALCKKQHKKAQLLTINKENQHKAVRQALSKMDKKKLKASCHGKHFFTSGQRRQLECESAFVWKPNNVTLPINPNSIRFAMDSPNCHKNEEHCLALRYDRGSFMNDIDCNKKLCSICQISM